MQSQEEKVGFEDRFVILLKMRHSGAAELRYTFVYGKSQLNSY
jgi:hypothetical protein